MTIVFRVEFGKFVVDVLSTFNSKPIQPKIFKQNQMHINQEWRIKIRCLVVFYPNYHCTDEDGSCRFGKKRFLGDGHDVLLKFRLDDVIN